MKQSKIFNKISLAENFITKQENSFLIDKIRKFELKVPLTLN